MAQAVDVSNVISGETVFYKQFRSDFQAKQKFSQMEQGVVSDLSKMFCVQAMKQLGQLFAQATLQSADLNEKKQGSVQQFFNRKIEEILSFPQNTRQLMRAFVFHFKCGHAPVRHLCIDLAQEGMLHRIADWDKKIISKATKCSAVFSRKTSLHKQFF